MAQPVAMSFSAALERSDRVAPALAAAKHAQNAARLTEESLSTLNRPIVTVSAQYVEYQKTLSLDLTGPRRDALDSTNSFLNSIPGSVAPEFQAIAADVVGRISQALPGLFSALPSELSYRFRQDVFRPTVQGILPIYTGGAISAIKRGAEAGTALSEARARSARDLTQVNLIRAYFGQLAAASLEDSTRQSLEALDDLLSDAVKLEMAGFIPRARRLEAQVARDAAERQYERAVLAHDSARSDLAGLLEVEGVTPTTSLFVQTAPLPPSSEFLGGEDDLPQTREADAAKAVARAGVDLARSRQRPQAFAFGEYNLNRSNALPVEPDWILGVGVRYTLLSNVGRSQAVAAAREQEAAADETARGARQTSRTATLRAWNLVESARRSFVSLDSSLAAATENLRVQRISFREGEGTVTEVTGAEAALAATRTQRVATAYEYDLALAALLTAAGRLDSFPGYLAAANVRVPILATR
ncbi:TolC family protein [Sphingomonas sp.]|jgi:outer membrane protein TolC|uniref:TolC family protein n=1 Tax=Sphingomonas sp. TaxID=28214 RepID=UPI00261BDB01|nr:TolC family protein [Sphingomonas sp.]MDF2493400.1 TolC family protein [Sphingomonas sp.]